MMSADACPVPWPVCPDCLGEPLNGIAAIEWRCPRCRRRFATSERMPCPDAATVMIRDTARAGGAMCRSHAVRAHVMIIGSTVEGLDDAALAAAAGLEARDKETDTFRAADNARELAELDGKLAPLDPERRAEIAAFNNGTHSVFRPYGLSPEEAARMVKLGRKRDDEGDQ